MALTRLRAGGVERGVGEAAGLRAVQHLGVLLGGGDGHERSLVVCGVHGHSSEAASRGRDAATAAAGSGRRPAAAERIAIPSRRARPNPRSRANPVARLSAMVSLTADMSPLHPDRNLALELVRATEAAAIRAVPVHRARRRRSSPTAPRSTRCAPSSRPSTSTASIVIGEGEKDDAPMLFNGENVGNGRGPQCDIAVDPIDGTSLTAAGRNNALSVIAVVRPRHDARRVDGLLHGQARHRPGRRRRRRHPPARSARTSGCSPRRSDKPVDEIVVSVLQPSAPRAAHRRHPRGRRRHAADARRRRRRRHQRRPPQRAHRHVRRRRRQPRGHRHGVRDQGARRAHPGTPLAARRRREAEGHRCRSRASTATSTRPTNW